MSTPKRNSSGLGTGPRGASRRRLVLSISLVSAGVGLSLYANISRSGSDARVAAPLRAATTPVHGQRSDAAGMVVAIDPETGALTQPTAAQMQELQGPKTDAAQKASEVTTYRRADGTVIAHLDESFDHYSVVAIGADGKMQHVCQRPALDCSLHTRHAGPSAATVEK